MRDWVVRNLSRGYRLHSYHGVRPGDAVRVHGWRHPYSVDERVVVSLVAGPCQSGVLVQLDQPLKNQPCAMGNPIDFDWLRKGGRA
jgi:hypothetical protein